MQTLNMIGQPCPIPVVNAKKALAQQDSQGVILIVDNFVAVQNLEKMAKGEKLGFSYSEDGESQWKVTITGRITGSIQGGHESAPSTAPFSGGSKKGPVVLITSECMGRGADELGKMLIKGFIFSLTQLNPLPEAVLFLNGGANLTTEGANTVPDLKVLAEKGTVIGTCGTCANYYKLTEKLAVGSIVDMMKITSAMAQASGVITI
ncbi:MAG: sulfurtransferase-like selenium metabolism protein YedF [Termitinemataceae bacterium]|nr:MAG: sulfurtransferase-like selenium metabolism protein YedF [Termitinemataceae bacterium]